MCNNNWVPSHGWSPFGGLSAVTCQDGFFHKRTFFKFACLLSIPQLSKGQHVNFLHSYIWLVLKIRLLWFSEVRLMGKAFWQPCLTGALTSVFVLWVFLVFFSPLPNSWVSFTQASSIHTLFRCFCLPYWQTVPKLMKPSEQESQSWRASNIFSLNSAFSPHPKKGIKFITQGEPINKATPMGTRRELKLLQMKKAVERCGVSQDTALWSCATHFFYWVVQHARQDFRSIWQWFQEDTGSWKWVSVHSQSYLQD